jgi:PIN domain nuclease of toxin-antitoxin system
LKVLLDTHALLWLVSGDLRVSAKVRKVFLDPANELFVSAVTGFEIVVKHSLGKLHLEEPPREFIENRIRNNALSRMPVTLDHTYRLAGLPYHHRDPFDRLLAAQSLEEDIPLLTADSIFKKYGVEVVW